MEDRKQSPAKGQNLNQPFHFKDLMNCQEGSIVSRTIVDKPEGTVTVFAFDQGQNLSEHTAPFDALVQVIDGQGTVTINGIDHTVPTNGAILMPAHIPHAVRADMRFKMILTLIRSKG